MHNDLSKSLMPSWYSMQTIHQDIRQAYGLIYHPNEMTCSEPVREKEGFAYGAHSFKVGNASIQFRTAKTTPLKAGHFATFWKRLETGIIGPYDDRDSFDFLVISVRSYLGFGQFVFPKSLLSKMNIISKDGQGGKRALRIYPDWCTALNSQALKTQKWQSGYFLDLTHEGEVDMERAQKLYQLHQEE